MKPNSIPSAGTNAEQRTDVEATSVSPFLAKPNVSRRLNVYEYIWSKVFPNEELNYDDFYDWSRENANKALELALEYCDVNGG